ncbi:MAG: DUF1311 domain-containing protein [Cyanobacteria bacterium NC_groundwater_1444_Ag_S-0.65um_54_12]|nr:DUF1311 domain-containing protein [Cyanobacteria bacterium NC_groundwater_1444_Ag_S-0.65um_54_12]
MTGNAAVLNGKAVKLPKSQLPRTKKTVKPTQNQQLRRSIGNDNLTLNGNRTSSNEASDAAYRSELIAIIDDLQVADRELNSAYQELQQKLSRLDFGSNEIKQHLIHAQRAWIKYRDREAQSESHLSSGKKDKLQSALDAKARLTEERAKLLQRALRDEELVPEDDQIDGAVSNYERSLRLEEKLKKTENELNQVYQQLKNVITSRRSSMEGQEIVTDLKKAQHAWRNFRDKESLFRSDSTWGGSMQGRLMLAAEIALTRERIQTLRQEIELWDLM